MNVILSTYFTTKKDPQRESKWANNDYSIIKIWKESVEKLNLNGIVFNDSLSNDFINTYQSENIKFVKIDPNYEWSTNDHRFLVYNRFLKSNNDIDFAFMTDISDVKVVKNPFEEIDKNNLHDKIIAGTNRPSIISKSRWAKRKNYGYIPEYASFWKTINSPVVNAGVLGGSRENLIDFTTLMIKEFSKINTKGKNNNMAVFNYVAYKFFREKIITGEPICSQFKKFQNDRQDVWFIHK